MIAAKPLSPTTWEICRVYLHPGLHGTGLATHLLQTAEAHAATAGATTLELWTDTRFTRAHRFYEKHGYIRTAHRALHDLCRSEEWRYEKPVPPRGPDQLGPR